MSTQVYIKCPVHGDKLPQENFYGMEVYFCERCQKYFAQSRNLSNENKATYNGHTIVFKEKLEPMMVENDKTISQEHSASDIFQRQFDSLPNSSENLMCPIHKTYLTTRLAFLPLSKNKSTAVGFCPKCDTLYTNDFVCASRKKMVLAGKRMLWSPLEIVHRPTKKNKNRYKQHSNSITVKTNNISIVSKSSKIPSHPGLITSATAVVSLTNLTIRVEGFFDSAEAMFYTTPQQFYMALLPEDLSSLSISDSNDLLKNYPHGKKQKTALRSYQESLRQSRKKLTTTEQEKYELLPIATYFQPVIYEKSKKCTFCSNKLSSNFAIKMAVYQNNQFYKWGIYGTLYCLNCKTPFIHHLQKDKINKRLAPKSIQVFDSRLCSSPAELVRIAVSSSFAQLKSNPKSSTQNQMLLPHEKELTVNLSLPNLSQVTASNYVLVFANICHCANCKEKYQRNTIKDRTALVKTQNGQVAKITVQFCIGCGRYFMNITTFRECCKKYGGLLLECKMDAELTSQNSSWINFAPDTVLSRCGYSVKKGIPKSQRQTILSYILDSKKATKYEVQEILSRFIRMRKHYQPEACARWQEDILFVNQYQIPKQEVVSGLSFKKSGHYREKN